MARFLSFNLLFLFCIGYALARGRGPERMVALIFCGARFLTDVALLTVGSSYRQPEMLVATVDLLTFAALTGVSLTADRFWPIPLAAMQGVSLLAHLGRLFSRDILPATYFNAVQLWAYPQLLLLLIGTLRVDLRLFHRPIGWWPFSQADGR